MSRAAGLNPLAQLPTLNRPLVGNLEIREMIPCDIEQPLKTRIIPQKPRTPAVVNSIIFLYTMGSILNAVANRAYGPQSIDQAPRPHRAGRAATRERQRKLSGPRKPLTGDAMYRKSFIWLSILFLVVATSVTAQEEVPQPAPPEASAEKAVQPAGDSALRFNFADAQWPKVLEWFAEQADLSLDLTDEPAGTFNYIDNKQHTVTEALDVLNGYLLPRGYVLLRRDQFLVAMKTDNAMLPNLIPTVPASTLDEYGDNELLRIVVPIKGFEPAEVADQLVKILGANGMASPLDSSNSLVLQGFGASLRQAVDLLDATVAPPADDELVFRSFPLQHIPAADAERQIHNLFGLGTNPFRTSMQRRAEWEQRRGRGRGRWGDDDDDDRDNRPAAPTPLVQNIAMNMKVSALTHTNSLLVTATPAAIRLIEGILETIDVRPPTGEASVFTNNTPELRVYTVDNADEDDVAATVDAVIPGVVINEDGRNNSIHVLATPAEHRDVEELISIIDSGGVGNGVQVIPLTQTDPVMMSELLAELFENEDRDDRPVITPGFRNRSLIVRGTSAQVAEIKKALASFNEGEGAIGSTDVDSRFRRLPLGTSRDAERVARMVKELLEDDRRFDNQIRVVVPSDEPAVNDRRAAEDRQAADDLRRVPVDTSSSRPYRASQPRIVPIGYEDLGATDTVLAALQIENESADDEDLAAEEVNDEPAPAEAPERRGTPRVTIEVRGSELFIYSNDDVALDQVEETIRDLVQQMPSRTEWTVFFLRAAPAEGTAQTLVDLLRAGNYTDAIIGAGPDYGYGGLGSQPMRIVPDARTNSLFVSGPEAQVEQAERFLRFLDTTELPESLRDRVPRSIPVEYADVNDVAQMIRELYQDFMVDPNAAARGGRRGDRDRGDDDDQRLAAITAAQAQNPGLRPSGIQLTLAVDENANTLLVSCNDQLFEQIRTLVRQRDQAAQGSQPVVRVLQLDPASATQVRAALNGITETTDTATTTTAPAEESRRRRER